MRIALIGATGFVGTVILHEALSRGMQVTAIVRHPEKLKAQDNLTLEKGDIMDTNHLAEILKGNDVVVSAYNAGWTNPDLYNEFMKGSKSIQDAVKQSGVTRYIVNGGAGSSYIKPGIQLVDTTDFPEVYKPGARAARDYLNYLKEEKDLDWTFVTPAIEMNQQTPHQRTGKYRTGADSLVFDTNNRSRISVEDLAVAIVDEVENPKHKQARFTVGY